MLLCVVNIVIYFSEDKFTTSTIATHHWRVDQYANLIDSTRLGDKNHLKIVQAPKQVWSLSENSNIQITFVTCIYVRIFNVFLFEQGVTYSHTSRTLKSLWGHDWGICWSFIQTQIRSPLFSRWQNLSLQLLPVILSCFPSPSLHLWVPHQTNQLSPALPTI